VKKPTKKQIDDMAKRLYGCFHMGRLIRPWEDLKGAPYNVMRGDWLRVARYVMVALPIEDLLRTAKPKSCRLVDGKVVCK
jgi:hypothetical protein